MIIFHEGMPRSGKSYAACKDHIIPSLKKGRTVYARIDGLNYAQIAELAGITEEECRRLLIELTEEEAGRLETLELEKDALIVIDEAQNYWPQQKAQLPTPILKWIAEHGHHGFDVLLMGQLLKDVHRAWMNRTNRKLQFIKKDMLGQDDKYKWIMYHGSPDARGNVKFTEVQKGDQPYEEKYFGCYKSHSDGTENKANYEDERVNVFKSAMFRKWLPLLAVCSLLGIGYLVHLFQGGLAVEKKPDTVAAAKPVQAQPAMQAPAPLPAPKVQPEPEPAPVSRKPAMEADWPDLVADLSRAHRIRVAGVMRTNKATTVLVEWRDSGMRVVDQMTSDQLKVLGWYPLVTDDDRMAILAKPGARLVATAWPIEEPVGKVSEPMNQQIKRESQDFPRSAGIGGPSTTPARYVPASYQEERLPETAPISARDALPMVKTRF